MGFLTIHFDIVALSIPDFSLSFANSEVSNKVIILGSGACVSKGNEQQ